MTDFVNFTPFNNSGRFHSLRPVKTDKGWTQERVLMGSEQEEDQQKKSTDLETIQPEDVLSYLDNSTYYCGSVSSKKTDEEDGISITIYKKPEASEDRDGFFDFSNLDLDKTYDFKSEAGEEDAKTDLDSLSSQIYSYVKNAFDENDEEIDETSTKDYIQQLINQTVAEKKESFMSTHYANENISYSLRTLIKELLSKIDNSLYSTMQTTSSTEIKSVKQFVGDLYFG